MTCCYCQHVIHSNTLHIVDCHMHAFVEICFNCVLVLCFAIGYAHQFGETAHKREHYIIVIIITTFTRGRKVV